MELSKEQEKALRIAVDKYWNGEKYVCIAGYAGCGKTFTIKYIIASLGLAPDEVAYCAYTGKAAEVLRKNDCPNACTAHSLLYYNKRKPDGTFLHKPKAHFDKPYKVIVVDEVSMLPKNMWELLLSHNIFVIASGDPYQLPVLDPTQDNHVLDNPDIFLTQIFRQGEGSEIITLSLAIRENKAVIPYDGKQVKIITRDDVVSGMYTWADQIICSTNATRKSINNYVRELNGIDGDPQPGDKIISLTNHWNITDFSGDVPLTNGTSGILKASYFDNAHYPVKYRWFPKRVPLIRGHFITDDGADFGYLPIDHTYITQGKKFLDVKAEMLLSKMKTLENEIPLDFDYGYAISVWKSQGSSWGKVLVFEEGFPYETLEHRRALYTAITRAEDKLVLVLNDDKLPF